MSKLTADEIAFINKIEREKKLHAEAQKNYRKRKSQDPKYKEKVNEYMKNYNEKKQNKYSVIKKKLWDEAPPKTVLIPSVKEIAKNDKRTKKGKKQAAEIIPSYQTRKAELSDTTIKSYMSKANIIHRIFTKNSLSPQLEGVLLKLFNNEDFDEKKLVDNMDYLNDITPTIEELRANYYNDNSFKSYLNVLVVRTSHNII